MQNSPCDPFSSPTQHYSFRTRKNSNAERNGSPSLSGLSVNTCRHFYTISDINFSEKKKQILQDYRRPSLDTYGSPPYVPFHGDYCPDLDDIHEYKTDQHYFTHTGSTRDGRASVTNGHGILDQQTFRISEERLNRQRARFDNSSFIKSLNDSDASIGQSPKEKTSKSSLHGIFKNLGKKAHIWPRKRHESTCNMTSTGSPIVSSVTNDPQENFRSRSKSLDVNYTNNILNDCDATYKIFDKIVREGNFDNRIGFFL